MSVAIRDVRKTCLNDVPFDAIIFFDNFVRISTCKELYGFGPAIWNFLQDSAV